MAGRVSVVRRVELPKSHRRLLPQVAAELRVRSE
jgi:hypothetical protein